MDTIRANVYSRIDDIDTRRALGLGPRKLSMDRYIQIPTVCNGMKHTGETLIVYRNNGAQSTYIFFKPVQKISDTEFMSTIYTKYSIYRYNYSRRKGSFEFWPDTPHCLLFSNSPVSSDLPFQSLYSILIDETEVFLDSLFE